MTHEIPRRARVDLQTPAELAIGAAMAAVENAGAHVRLTDAVMLLGAAKDAVADFVDGVDGERLLPAPIDRPRKETSPDISSLAAKVLGGYTPTPEEWRRMAASVLSQDETGAGSP